MNSKWEMITQCVMWIVTSIAVIAGLYVTRDVSCLFAFAIPAILQILMKFSNLNF